MSEATTVTREKRSVALSSGSELPAGGIGMITHQCSEGTRVLDLGVDDLGEIVEVRLGKTTIVRGDGSWVDALKDHEAIEAGGVFLIVRVQNNAPAPRIVQGYASLEDRVHVAQVVDAIGGDAAASTPSVPREPAVDPRVERVVTEHGPTTYESGPAFGTASQPRVVSNVSAKKGVTPSRSMGAGGSFGSRQPPRVVTGVSSGVQPPVPNRRVITNEAAASSSNPMHRPGTFANSTPRGSSPTGMGSFGGPVGGTAVSDTQRSVLAKPDERVISAPMGHVESLLRNLQGGPPVRPAARSTLSVAVDQASELGGNALLSDNGVAIVLTDPDRDALRTFLLEWLPLEEASHARIVSAIQLGLDRLTGAPMTPANPSSPVAAPTAVSTHSSSPISVEGGATASP